MLSCALGEQAHQFILAAIGVLIFVHHDEFVAAVQRSRVGCVVRQQADGFEQQVVEIQRVRLAQALFVPFVDDGQARGHRIGGARVDDLAGDSLWLLAWLMRESAARYGMNFSSRPSCL